MSARSLASKTTSPAVASTWRELWVKEDWWAIWLGLGIVVLGYVLFANGLSLKWIAVTPDKWSSLSQLGAHFAANAPRYLAQFVAWLVLFSVALGGARPPRARFRALLRISLCLLGRDLRRRPMDAGQHLQSRAAAGRAAARPCHFQPDRPAPLDGRRLPRRILREDRHRTARRDAALLAHPLGGAGRDPAGLARLARDLLRHLFRRAQTWARPPTRGDARRGRRGLRRLGGDRHRRRRRRQEGGRVRSPSRW